MSKLCRAESLAEGRSRRRWTGIVAPFVARSSNVVTDYQFSIRPSSHFEFDCVRSEGDGEQPWCLEGGRRRPRSATLAGRGVTHTPVRGSKLRPQEVRAVSGDRPRTQVVAIGNDPPLGGRETGFAPAEYLSPRSAVGKVRASRTFCFFWRERRCRVRSSTTD